MESNLPNPQVNLPSNIGPVIRKSTQKKVWIILIIMVLVVAGIVGVSYFKLQTKLPGFSNPEQTNNTPYTSYAGFVTAFKDNSLTIRSGAEDKSFSLSSKSVIQQESTSSAQTDTSLSLSSLPTSSIKVGQEVQLQINKNTNEIVSLVIKPVQYIESNSKPADSYLGTVVSKSGNNLVVKIGDTNKTISTTSNTVIKKIIANSKNPEPTEPQVVSFADIQVGDNINALLDKVNGQAITVIIIQSS